MKLRARCRKAANWPRVTNPSGQNRSLSGGLQPFVIPAVASPYVLGENTPDRNVDEARMRVRFEAKRSYEECGESRSCQRASGTELVIVRWVAATRDVRCGKTPMSSAKTLSTGTSAKAGWLLSVKPSPLTRNADIVCLVTTSSGQNSSFVGGLHPRVMSSPDSHRMSSRKI